MPALNKILAKILTKPVLTHRTVGLSVLLALVLAACSSAAAPSGPTQLPANAVQVYFLYSSEKQAWVEAVTKTFNESQAKTASGKVISVMTKAAGSGESMDAIVSGTDQPALWSPASGLWVPLMNDQWTQKQGKDLITETCPNVVLSPVVIMMWKPMAEALGWPNKDIGWADIDKIATDPKGWADYGAPQFGEFRFGHTHPEFSNSGLQTIVAMAYAATNKQKGLTVDDVNAPATAKYINTLESSVAHYGSSTGFFGDAMIARGTSYLSAAVVYESVVVSSYNPKNTPEFPLVAIYPKEGTFLSDHPVCIPDAPWVSAEQKEAAGIYRKYLLSTPAQQQALQFGFRPSDTTIAIGAPIDAAHGVDPKKPDSILAVPDAKTINAIRTLWKAQKKQVNLTMLMDVSGSMADNNKISGARDGAAQFIDQLDPADNLSLITFDEKHYVLFANWNVGEKRAEMKKIVSQIVPQGSTALYDSIAFAVQQTPIDPTRINGVVVMTDGQDNDSTQYTGPDALGSLFGSHAEGKYKDVIVFTIGYGKDADNAVLQKIADIGRGSYSQSPTASDIVTVYRNISTFF